MVPSAATSVLLAALIFSGTRFATCRQGLPAATSDQGVQRGVIAASLEVDWLINAVHLEQIAVNLPT